MSRRCRIACWLVVTLLVAGQVAATAHAYAHDVGTSPHPGCASCVHAVQLAAASSDSGPMTTLQCAPVVYRTPAAAAPISAERGIARQRGPPVPA